MPRALRVGTWLGSVWFGGLCVPSSVLAHAGPQVRDIRPEAKGQSQLLVSNRGLILRGSESAPWQLMCNEALSVSTVEIPDVAVLADGRWLAGTVRGLKASDDAGCSWQGVEPYAALSVPSLMQHPLQLNRVYITTYGAGQSALRTSADAGKTWQSLLDVEDSDYLRFIRISERQPEHLYVRSVRFGSGQDFVYSVLHSSDAGQHWQRHEVPVAATETDLVLLGASPDDPNLLVAKAEAADPTRPERLLVSHDGAENFTSPMQARVISAAAWSSDGKTLWIAADEGLWRSGDGAQTFQRVGTAEYVSCVLERKGELLACGFYHGVAAGFPGIGVSKDGGETFERWMGLNQVVQPIACGATTPTATACASLWIDWQREILGTTDPIPDAGQPDAATMLDASNQSDARTPTNASAADGGAAQDGQGDAAADGGEMFRRGQAGCNCQLAKANTRLPTPWAWLAAGALFGLWQSRRSKRARDA